MFPTTTPTPSNLPSPQMVNNLAGTFNSTVASQAKAPPVASKTTAPTT